MEPDTDGNINVGPKVCNMNIGDDGEQENLDDEPGILELEELYFDDNYDFKTGKFTGMSENTRKVYLNDLQIFYNVFTGKSGSLPPEITRFSDIRLRDYNKMDKCNGENPLFKIKFKGPLTNKLFNDYAENLKKMIQTTNKNQQLLLTIINQIFVYTLDPQSGKKQIRIIPSLTEERLQEIVIETRALVIKLYLNCEIDYVNGLNIYEAIVEEKILPTVQNQIKNLQSISDELIVQDKIPEPAEVKQIQQKAEKKISEKKEQIEKQLEDIKKYEEIVSQEPSSILKTNIVEEAAAEAEIEDEIIADIPKPQATVPNVL